MRIGLVGAGAIAQRHLEVLASPGRRGGRGVRHRRAAGECSPRPDQARAPTPIEGRCSTPSHWTRCSCARRPRRMSSPPRRRWGGGSPSTWRSRWRGPSATARRSCRAWAASPAVCAVGYQWRSLDVVGTLRRALGDAPPGMLVSRSFGPTEGGRNDLAQAGAGSWFLDPRRSGGILFELGSHDIDLQLAVAGPVESVWATAARGRLALAGAPAGELDDAVSVFMQFESGCLGAVHIGWTDAQDPAVYTPRRAGPGGRAQARARSGLPADRAGRRTARSTPSRPPIRAIPRSTGSSRRCAPAIAAWCRARPRTRWARFARILACEQAIATGERVTVGWK